MAMAKVIPIVKNFTLIKETSVGMIRSRASRDPGIEKGERKTWPQRTPSAVHVKTIIQIEPQAPNTSEQKTSRFGKRLSPLPHSVDRLAEAFSHLVQLFGQAVDLVSIQPPFGRGVLGGRAQL